MRPWNLDDPFEAAAYDSIVALQNERDGLRTELVNMKRDRDTLQSWLMDAGRRAGRTIPLHPDPQIRRIVLECCGPAEAKNNIDSLCSYFNDQRKKLEKMTIEVQSVLDHCGSDYVRCREGGGFEDIAASLSLTVARIRAQRDDADSAMLFQANEAGWTIAERDGLFKMATLCGEPGCTNHAMWQYPIPEDMGPWSFFCDKHVTEELLLHPERYEIYGADEYRRAIARVL